MGLFINLLLSLFLLVGAYISYSSKNEEKMELISIALGFGTMTSLVIVELIPEALENLGLKYIWLFVLGLALGIFLLKQLDKLVPEHDHHHGLHHDCSEENVKHIGIVSSLALIIHNLVEGMSVYAVCNSDLKSGLIMAFSIGLHNIVMGMVIYSTLKHEKETVRFLVFGCTALSTFIGAVIMKLLWFMVTDVLVGVLLTFATGMLIYIVIFELLPHLLHSENKKTCVVYALVGIFVTMIGMFF